ncbi:MAG TPA: hypothetical protein VK395_33830 [Gemmataceae bacterium]|nr:hypothetical protein [Gemmataceae bacterium]
MFKFRIAVGSAVVLALSIGCVLAADKLTSGPQVGQSVPGPFHPLNINGAKAGEKNCLYCQNGTNPVAMIFAREVSEPLTTLIKKIDACTEANKDAKMGSFVVFLSDSEDLQSKLKEVVDKESLKNIILSIDNPAGPKGYKVSKEADVTVVLYTNHTVKANFAYGKGELKDKDIETVVASVPKILTTE